MDTVMYFLGLSQGEAGTFSRLGEEVSMRRKSFSNLIVFLLMVAPFTVYAQEFLGDPKSGNAIYAQNCLRCHGSNGDGNGEEGQFLVVKPANFHSTKSITKTNSELFTTIKYGLIFSPMHGWGDRLTDQQIADVVAYIRFLAPFRALADAREIFEGTLSVSGLERAILRRS